MCSIVNHSPCLKLSNQPIISRVLAKCKKMLDYRESTVYSIDEDDTFFKFGNVLYFIEVHP